MELGRRRTSGRRRLRNKLQAGWEAEGPGYPGREEPRGGRSQEEDEDQEEPREAPEKPEPRVEPWGREGKSQEGDESQEGPREAPEKPEPRAKFPAI